MNNNATQHKRFNWKSFMPVLQWLPAYKAEFLRWDIIAGITLAFFVMPESLAYASLAGVPPQYGIYCCFAGGLIFALFTTSRQVAVGPTSAISLMIGSTVAVLSGGDTDRWIAIAGLTALLVAVLCLIAFLFKLSSLVNFISESILLGFKAGAALSIASTQLPKLFGVEGGGSNFFGRMSVLFQHLPEMNIAVLVFGLVTLALLIAGNTFFPGKPVSLFVVIGAILVITYSTLASMGIHLTGDIPKGLPSLGRPSLRMSDVDGVLELAFACFVMGYIETVSAARMFAQKNNYEINPRQELLSLGAANFAAAFSSAYAVSGGLSQSTVNDKAGAKTPLALIICSLALGILLFFTGLLKNLPEVVLAVIVLDAIAGLIKVKELKRIYQLSKLEFAVAMIALVGVLFLGILKGVIIAVIMSLVFLLSRTSTPHVARLGRIKGTSRFSDTERHPGNEQFDGLLMIRVEASFIYFNAEFIAEQIKGYIEAAQTTPYLLILDMSSSPYVDVAGSKMLLKLHKQLEEKNIDLRIVEARANVRDILRLQGMDHISRYTSCNDLVEEFLSEQKLQPLQS